MFANFSAIVLVNNPKLVAAILRLFRVETYLLRLCARTPSLQGRQPSSRCRARLTLEGRLDFAYLLLHHPEVFIFSRTFSFETGTDRDTRALSIFSSVFSPTIPLFCPTDISSNTSAMPFSAFSLDVSPNIYTLLAAETASIISHVLSTFSFASFRIY